MEITNTEKSITPTKRIIIPKVLQIVVIIFGFGLFGLGGYFIGISKYVTERQGKVIENTVINSTATPAPETLCGIDKFRLSKPITFSGKQYFIYTRNSMNVVLPQAERNYLESGVFVVDNEKGENCKKLIEIFDESPAKNNIYELFDNNGILYVLTVDQFGAGSGEGNAKILKSNDNGKSWEVKYCFYYTPEMKATIKDFISGTQGNIKLMSLSNPYCKDFILGVAGGRLR